MEFPSDLLQKVQYDYVGKMYRDGVFTFPSLDEETIKIIIEGFLAWAEENKHIENNKLDLDFIEMD